MVALVYSAGLRIGELIDMEIRDIDSSRMIIHIREGKGRKDRVIPLSERILVILRVYYKKYEPKKYLFEGQSGGKYSSSSFNKILKKSALKAKINKSITAHTLRHS